MAAGNFIGFATRLILSTAHRKKLSNVIERKPEIASMADKAQRGHRRCGIATLVSSRPQRLREKVIVLVVANRLDLASGLSCELANR